MIEKTHNKCQQEYVETEASDITNGNVKWYSHVAKSLPVSNDQILMDKQNVVHIYLRNAIQ